MEIVLPALVYSLGEGISMRKFRAALEEYGYPSWIFKLANYEPLPEAEKKKFLEAFEKALNGDTSVSDKDALVIASILTKNKLVPKLPPISEALFQVISTPLLDPPVNLEILEFAVKTAVNNKEPHIFPQAIADVFGLQDRIATYNDLVQLNKGHPQYEEKYEYFRNLAEKYKKDPWNFVNEVLEKYDLEEMMYAYMLLSLSFTAGDSVDTYVTLAYAIILAMSTMDDIDVDKELENPKGTINDVAIAFSYMDSTKEEIMGAFSILTAINAVYSLI